MDENFEKYQQRIIQYTDDAEKAVGKIKVYESITNKIAITQQKKSPKIPK
jgi:hypothetical protein